MFHHARQHSSIGECFWANVALRQHRKIGPMPDHALGVVLDLFSVALNVNQRGLFPEGSFCRQHIGIRVWESNGFSNDGEVRLQ